VLEYADSGEGDLLCGGLDLCVGARANHVGLEESSLEHHVVIGEGLVASSDDSLGHGGGNLNAEVTVHEDLGLYDRHKAVLLADRGVSGESVGILVDGDLRGSSTDGVLDVENSSPLGESSALGVVLGTTSIEVINALCNALSVGSSQWLDALVDLKIRFVNSVRYRSHPAVDQGYCG
jgi:hypothetical protein